MGEATARRLPNRWRAVVAGEIVLAAAISSLWLVIVDGLGWPRARVDTVLSVAFIAAPAGITILLAWLAHWLWRRDRRRAAAACMILPAAALLALVLSWASLFA